jgi:predicted CopG family antitoxin
MVTTIQISEDLRDRLQKYKKSSKESYEDVIKELIEEKESSKNNEVNLLREGYEEMYGLSKEINYDFEDIDLEEMKKDD